MKENVDVIPLTGDTHVLDKDILSMIEDSLKYDLVSVEAGSGYGKTGIFKTYFENSDKRYIWLKMNRFDNVPEQFWLRLLSGILKLDRCIFEKMKTVSFPDSPEHLQDVLDILERRTDGLGAFVILDDFQHITKPRILRLLQNIVLAEPKGLKIILLSRKEPKLDFSLLYKHDKVKRLTEGDISFHKKEIHMYLQKNGILSREETAEELLSYTQGWRLAVDLFVRSLKRGNRMDEVSGDVELVILRLIKNEIFENYPDYIKDGLAKLSFLEVYPLQLVMELTDFGYEDITLILRNNPFINYDAQADMLEIHHFFTGFIRRQQERLDVWEQAAVKRQAANWLMIHDYGESALSCYLVNKEYQQVLKVAGQYIAYGGSENSMAGILSILDKLPSEVKSLFPIIYFYKSYLYFQELELQMAEKELRNLRMVLAGKEQDKELLGETYILEGMICFIKKDVDFGLYFKKAFRFIPEGSRMQYRIAPFLDGGIGFFAKSLDVNEIDRMLVAYKQGLPCMIRLTDGCGAGLLDYVMGQLAYYEGNLEKGEWYARQALRQAKEMNQQDMVFGSYLLLFKIAIWQGGCKLALDIWTKHIKGQEQKCHWGTVRGCGEALFHLYNEATLKVLVLYLRGKYQEAIAYLDAIESRTDGKNRIFSSIYQSLIRSMCYFAYGDDEAGAKAFQKAYVMAESGKYKGFFVEFGRIMKRTIAQIKNMEVNRISQSWLDEVSRESEMYGKLLSDIKKSYWRMYDMEKAISLSKEERNILEGWCQGMPRQEIARKNSMSENMVKARQKRIYKKLEGMAVSDAVHIYALLNPEQDY